MQTLEPQRYQLLERIAQGGMAEVFRARALGAHGFEKTIAVKRILPELARHREFEERFIAEAKLAVQLGHANVVQVLDFGHLGGTLFIAMEFIEGCDLANLLRLYREKKQQVPREAAFFIAMEMLRGLGYAHEFGIVHHDVSPSNVLLSRSGEVKLADFGIAQAASVGNATETANRVMGKWRYMSPEQTQGQALMPESDVFSAGIVLFELFTGERLFAGENPNEIAESIRYQTIPSTQSLRADLPKRLDALLARMLTREPTDRTITAADVVRELIEICYQSNVIATPQDVASVVKQVQALASEKSKIEQGILQQLKFEATPERRTSVPSMPAVPQVAEAQLELTSGGAFTQTFRKEANKEGITVWALEGATVAAAPAAMKADKGRGATVMIRGGNYKSLKTLAIYGSIAALAAAGWLLFKVPRNNVVLPISAAMPKARVDIESQPTGAEVWVNGSRVGVTPTQVSLLPDTPHQVRLELDGYIEWAERELVASPGERIRLRPVLMAKLASLTLTTEPDGASSWLGDTALGLTPVTASDIAPGRRTIRIEKKGYESQTFELDFSRGETKSERRVLKAIVVYGRVNINIPESWADVFLDGRHVGRVPGPVDLPVGKNVLFLKNEVTGRTKRVLVVVPKNQVKNYSFPL